MSKSSSPAAGGPWTSAVTTGALVAAGVASFAYGAYLYARPPTATPTASAASAATAIAPAAAAAGNAASKVEDKVGAELLTAAANSAFGVPIRRMSFQLDASNKWLFLNHGSYGTVPRYVAHKQREWTRQMEANPDLWFRETVYPQTRAVLSRVATSLVNCQARDLVFVPNATTACHTVFSSIANAKRLKKGDKVLMLDLIYPAVKHSVIECCERTEAELIEVQTPLPVTAAADIVSAVERALDAYGSDVKVAIFDHITSSTGLILPVKALSDLCAARGVMCVIDGAHAIGQTPIDLTAWSGVDFYCSNFHKWLYSPKGSCFLYAKSQHQTWLQPTVTSHEWKNLDWTKRFNMQGTNDATTYLSVGDAMTFIETVGAKKMDSYRREQTEWIVSTVAQRWKSMAVCPASMRAYMALVTLPLPETSAEIKLAAEQLATNGCVEPPKVSARSAWLMNKLLKDHATVLPIMSHGGRVWCRFSSQIYNDRMEYTRLFDLIDQIVAAKQYETEPAANVLPDTGFVIPNWEHVRASKPKPATAAAAVKK